MVSHPKKTNLCHCQFVLMPSNIHFFLGPLLIGIPSHWLFACRSRFSPSTGVCWAWNPPIVADHHDTPAVTGGLHPLLDIFTEKPKNPDVTLWPGNVPGQWLHVRLLVSEVAFEPPVVSWWKASIWDHQHPPQCYQAHMSWQTNVSMVRSVSTSSLSDVPKAANADITSMEHLLSACQQVSFPLPANRPVTSAPEKAWNPGKASSCASPSAFTIGPSEITRFLFPTPVTKYVFLQSWW